MAGFFAQIGPLFAPGGPVAAFTEGIELRRALFAVLTLLVAVFAGRLLGAALASALRTVTTPTWQEMARRVVAWGLAGLGVATALQAFGVELSVLLGAAGVFTVAIGFAAQTSTSNLISGLFLMLEQTVQVGDVVEVDGVTGEVIAIDPLSVRLRTFDNRMVRVPIETLVKARLTNLSRFPIRRVDLTLQVPQEMDLLALDSALIELAAELPEVLQEPAPQVMVRGFLEGRADVLFCFWTRQDRFVTTRTQLCARLPGWLKARGLGLSLPRVALAPEAAG